MSLHEGCDDPKDYAPARRRSWPHTQQTSTQSTRRYRFWIDTLCCPVETTGKAVTLSKMADIYRNATHVLILDKSLRDVDTRTTPLMETLLHALYLSKYMTRLWTLQGGGRRRFSSCHRSILTRSFARGCACQKPLLSIQGQGGQHCHALPRRQLPSKPRQLDNVDQNPFESKSIPKSPITSRSKSNRG